MTLILASNSPRRRELLKEMGVHFRVEVSSVDESTIAADHPRTFAIRAAYSKAVEVASRSPEDCWVMGADTVVTQNMILYGKPNCPKDAARMLRELAGATHTVITAVVLQRAGSMTSFIETESTEVTFRALKEQEIAAYVATGEPLDKAGAYGIQGLGGSLIERIDGDYFNVVGLPCRLVARMLEQAQLPPARQLPETPERWLD